MIGGLFPSLCQKGVHFNDVNRHPPWGREGVTSAVRKGRDSALDVVYRSWYEYYIEIQCSLELQRKRNTWLSILRLKHSETYQSIPGKLKENLEWRFIWCSDWMRGHFDFQEIKIIRTSVFRMDVCLPFARLHINGAGSV